MGLLPIPKTMMLLASVAGSLVSSFVMVQQPASAGRYVINQPVETLNSYFDEPTRPGSSHSDGDALRLVHGYDADELYQRLFDRTWDDGHFKVHFVDGRAQRIDIGFPTSYASNRHPEAAATIFEYFFGYAPPIAEHISTERTIDQYSRSLFCMGDGMYVSFMHIPQGTTTLFASLGYSLACEPPYEFGAETVDAAQETDWVTGNAVDQNE